MRFERTATHRIIRNAAFIAAAIAVVFAAGISLCDAQSLRISSNGRFFTEANGKPFFWLGDTGWLLVKRCSREDIIRYLDKRTNQGFNVVQVMLLHDLKDTKNFYGSEAVTGRDASKPRVTPGNDLKKPGEYDYWDHVEWMVDEAGKRGIIAGLVPVWGSNVAEKLIDVSQAKAYARFLAERFRDKPNVVWINGGDLRGDQGREIWETIGSTLRETDHGHLITFHPRGRTSSSDWFHAERWLDFDMFQSGHRTYAQDNSPNEKHHFGEDNWRYVKMAWPLTPTKPILDGEPSYENIPQGLHDPDQPRWAAADVRRYAYWSVFAGGAGITYGENSTFQFYDPGTDEPVYGAAKSWRETIDSPGAKQLRYLKGLMLSKPYFERTPAQEMVVDQGERYDRIAATRGPGYAMFYTFTGRKFTIDPQLLGARRVRCSWYDPRTGRSTPIGGIRGRGKREFVPPGKSGPGNDWVLVIER